MCSFIGNDKLIEMYSHVSLCVLDSTGSEDVIELPNGMYMPHDKLINHYLLKFETVTNFM